MSYDTSNLIEVPVLKWAETVFVAEEVTQDKAVLAAIEQGLTERARRNIEEYYPGMRILKFEPSPLEVRQPLLDEIGLERPRWVALLTVAYSVWEG